MNLNDHIKICEALSFYADKSNYAETQIVGYEMASAVDLDGGEKARLAVEIIKKDNHR